MAVTVDILHLFPDLAAIGPTVLQLYCNDWLQRPIARECGITQLVINDQRNMEVLIDVMRALGRHERPGEVFFPVDELLDYIVDRHFTDSSERNRLHTAVRDTRKHWQATGKDYAAEVRRVGTLYFECKNPGCRSKMISDKQAGEGQRITFGPMDITCTTCNQTFTYDGNDFKLKFD